MRLTSSPLKATFGLGALVLLAITLGCDIKASCEISDSSVKVLLARVGLYHAAFQRQAYGDAYEMLASQWRKGGTDRQEWIDHVSRMGRTVRVVRWSIVSVETMGNRARVSVVVQAETPDGTQPDAAEVQFWECEHGEWYFIPIQLPDWNRAIAIPQRLPS